MPDRKTVKKIAKALGASRVEEIATSNTQGPLGLLALREELERRLRSSGGRPTDPEWNARRCVPFKVEIWAALAELAAKLSTNNRRVTPAQVASLLLERDLQALADIEDADPSFLKSLKASASRKNTPRSSGVSSTPSKS
jgi:hypothetical protein